MPDPRGRGRPRLPDEVKKARGTFRPSTSQAAADAEPQNEALAEYLARLHETFGTASHGEPVGDDVAFLRAAEAALRRYGIAERNGSALVELAAEAAERRLHVIGNDR